MVGNIRRLIRSAAEKLLWIRSTIKRNEHTIDPFFKIIFVIAFVFIPVKSVVEPVFEFGAWVVSKSPIALLSQNYLAVQQDSARSTKEKFDTSNEVSKSFVSGVGTIATISGGLFVFWNVRLTQTRLITERFSKAVEQLANDKLEIRLGGIYSLERLAQDSSNDRRTIMEVLTSFVREKSPVKVKEKKYGFVEEALAKLNNPAKPKSSSSEIPTDVQAVLDVIRRRHKQFQLFPSEGLDLSLTNLNQAMLFRVNLRGTSMYMCDLEDAYLYRSSFRECLFSESNLKGANLAKGDYEDTDFSGASLENANLSLSKFVNTNFEEATLKNASMFGCSLYTTNFAKADISGADFRNVKDLTVEQIIEAKNWKEAHYNPEFLERLNLLAEARGLKP